MKRVNGVSILIAVVLAVGYLVARPHVGTVYEYKEALFEREAVGSKFLESRVMDWYTTRPPCDKIAADSNSSELAYLAKPGDVIAHYSCVPVVRLLWGW